MALGFRKPRGYSLEVAMLNASSSTSFSGLRMNWTKLAGGHRATEMAFTQGKPR